MHAVTKSRASAKNDEPAPKKDGRHLRSERTRAAIVGALLALADEGELAPTAQQIADEAGVALRSIRQHFVTREELLVAAAAEHARRTSSARADVSPDAPLAARIAAFSEARATELEGTAALRRAAELAEGSSEIVARALSRARGQRRREVARVFATELAASKEPEALLDLLDLVSSGRGYDLLRHDRGHSSRVALARMERFLALALLR